MPFLCKRGSRNTCGALTVAWPQEKNCHLSPPVPPSQSPFPPCKHLLDFAHRASQLSHPSPPTTAFTKKHHPTQSTCKRGTENGPNRPKGLRVYNKSALHGPSSVNAASHGRWRGGERAQPGTDGDGLRATGGDGRRWATGGGSAGSYIRFRKRVMMPVLMRSTNMAPMMGTMMKGFTV